MRDKMSLKSLVWNRIISTGKLFDSTGKLFDAMYAFRHSDDALTLIE